jgi:molybdopterin/thiamine biosynthesis adenylyltransferase
VESIKKFLQALNSDIEVIAHKVVLNSSNAVEIVSSYDVVVDATDNVATRYLLNDCSVLSKKPLVSGSALQLERQITVCNFKTGLATDASSHSRDLQKQSRIVVESSEQVRILES